MKLGLDADTRFVVLFIRKHWWLSVFETRLPHLEDFYVLRDMPSMAMGLYEKAFRN